MIDGPFTLSDLMAAHEAVFGERLARDTLRRRMAPQLKAHLAEGAHRTHSDGGRPGRLWTGPRSTELSPDAKLRLALPRA